MRRKRFLENNIFLDKQKITGNLIIGYRRCWDCLFLFIHIIIYIGNELSRNNRISLQQYSCL